MEKNRQMSRSSAAPCEAEALPLQQFVLKIASRCNLRCTYCYMYASHDQSWRRQPATMSDDTIDAFVDRLSAHVELHGLRQVTMMLHGGEPLLAGQAYVRRLVDRVRARTPSGLRLGWHLPTTG